MLVETDALDLTTVEYTLEPAEFGNLLSRYDASAAAALYYHFDDLGSTAALTDAAEVVTDDYVYSAWGALEASTGSTEQPYQWVGESGYQYEPDLERYRVRRRDYDPAG